MGGYRPGSGRKPSKISAAARQLAEALVADTRTATVPVGPDGEPLKQRKFKDSLSYAMSVINDPTVPGDRKDRLAIAAMPFQHAKIAEKPIGKKEQQARDAKSAGNGSDWDDLMAKPLTPRMPKPLHPQMKFAS